MHAAQPPTSPPIQAPIAGTASASTPFADEQVVLTRQGYIQLQSDLNRVTSLHQRALKRERWYKERWRSLLNLEHLARRKREADLIAQLKTSAAKVRDLQQRLFGQQSEKGKGSSEAQISVTAPHPKRNKGHQPGAPNHGRTMHPEMPVVHEHCKQDSSVCPACHKPWRELCTTEDSSVIEIEVKAYLQACAGNGGQAPKDLSSFLPWSMDEARLQVMRASVPMASMEPITPNSAAVPQPPGRGREGGPAPPSPKRQAHSTPTQASPPTADVDTRS